MGWRLAEEVARGRPERPGPEWWTLLDLAQDANDGTRRGFPGVDYLLERAKCSKRTLYRRLRALQDAELIIVVSKSAPGKRTVYEITTGVSVSGIRPVVDGCQNQAERVPLTLARTGASVSGTPPVSTRHSSPVINRGAVDLNSSRRTVITASSTPREIEAAKQEWHAMLDAAGGAE